MNIQKIGKIHLSKRPEKFWSWVLITLFLLSVTSFLESNNSFARERFEFSVGKNVHVLSDKAFRRSKDQSFEAVGNVIITHDDNAIYGEKASLSFLTKDTEVIGNVRYIGPDMTMYGSKLKYNFDSKVFRLKNARILSDSYVVLGKTIEKKEDGTIVGEDAEYTTCQDCPESWSIFGRKVHIELGQYIRIWHAYIRVKGVIVMYVPYVILPIKKERETGLLFPSFGLDLDEGASFQQPWYWAINNSSDITLTPSFLGRRGFGNMFQYRKAFSSQSWIEFNSLQAFDKIYEPFKTSSTYNNKTDFRSLGSLEVYKSTVSDFNFYAFGMMEDDLDMVRDYDFYTNDYYLGPESETSSFLEIRKDLFQINVESAFNRSTLFSQPNEFDHEYIQILPKVNFDIVPLNIFQSDIKGLSRIDFGFHTDITNFKQNHYNNSVYFRNAYRLNTIPFLNWNLGQLGPVNVSTQTRYELQKYHFPFLEENRQYTKGAFIQESEISLTLEKIFGVAYTESLPIDKVKVQQIKTKNNSELIGTLPKIDSKLSRDSIKISKNSYRHRQEFKLKHYYLGDQTGTGNDQFGTQIRSDIGQFDYIDAPLDLQHEFNTTSSKRTLPVKNTLELQWNNVLIRKSASNFYSLKDGNGLRDNFDYSKISYFNISQGYDFSVTSSNLDEKLTRLYINTGVDINKFNFDFDHYYFYKESKNIIEFDLSYDFDMGEFSSGLRYDAFSVPINKILKLGGELDITSLVTLGLDYEYDIEEKRSNEGKYYFIYSPANNCWKLDLSLQKTRADTKWGINFLFNFNKNSFQSLF